MDVDPTIEHNITTVPTDNTNAEQNAQATDTQYLYKQYYLFDFTRRPHREWKTGDSIFGRFEVNQMRESQTKSGINFLKAVKWSPDGLCLLSNSEDNKMRLFELPQSTLNPEATISDDNQEALQLPAPCLSVNEGETIYDMAWFPFMNSTYPATCCFLSCSTANPIHLWDAFSGKLRCTYRAYNHVGEIATALSVSFNSTGQQVYCGFNKVIRVFDVERPGKDCYEISTVDDRKRGQSGLISCLAFAPMDVTGTAPSNHLFAAGSYNRTIGLYDERAGALELILNHGHIGGVTQVAFSGDGGYVFSGARKDGIVNMWDLRYTQQSLLSFERVVRTNQRIGFDVDPAMRHLITGSQDGAFLVYDLQTGEQVSRIDAEPDTAVNCVAMHPYLPLLATSSGERRFSLPEKYNEEDSIAEPETSTSDTPSAANDISNISLWRLHGTVTTVYYPTTTDQQEEQQQEISTAEAPQPETEFAE